MLRRSCIRGTDINATQESCPRSCGLVGINRHFFVAFYFNHGPKGLTSLLPWYTYAVRVLLRLWHFVFPCYRGWYYAWYDLYEYL